MVSVEEGRRFEEEKLVASREAASEWKEVMMKGNGFFERITRLGENDSKVAKFCSSRSGCLW